MALSCVKRFGFCPKYVWGGLDLVTCKKLNNYMINYEEYVNNNSSPDPAKHLHHYYIKSGVDGSYIFVLDFNQISYDRHMIDVKTQEEALRRYEHILAAMYGMGKKLEALIHEEVK